MSMKKRCARWALGMAGLCLGCPTYAVDCPIGWAVVNALGQNGTTGGGHGPVVHVSTKTAFVTYAGAASPCTIIVDSTSDSSWTNTAIVNATSHKTIIGANAGVVFDRFGLSMNSQSNIIIRNLTIKNVNPSDAIAMRTTHHVWIDHCDFSACTDGLLDITIASDYVTASWTKFHSQDKVSLVNSGTGHFEDVGKNRVTYHHNWFAHNVQRNPRIGYGKGHVFNNYYSNITSYCVGFHTGASLLVESNYFQNSANPLQQSYTGNSWEAAYADAKSVGNLFVSCTGTTSGTDKSFDPEVYYNYKFAADTAANVPTVVRASAGPMASGATNLICPTPGNGAIDIYTESLDLKWTDLEGVTSWDVYFGTTSSPPFQTNQTTRTYSPGTLAANTNCYWKVVANRANRSVSSDVWRFTTAPAKATKPFPAKNELHAPLRVPNNYTTCKPLELSWMPGIGVVSNSVYFGTNTVLTAADYQGAVTSPLYAPGQLQYGKSYYWRIDTVKTNGVVVTGDTWHFKSDVTYSTAGRTEAENMVRNGTYYLENDSGWFPASQNWTARLEDGPGTVSSVWSGSNSICNVRATYFDESDGTGWFGFYVNDVNQDEWYASANNDQLTARTINNVRLNTGDELRIAAYSNSGELNRTDCLDIFVSNTAPVLAAISDRVINIGMNLAITNVATDVDVPAQVMTFSLTNKPTNATYDTSRGVFNWRPLVTQANTTNAMMVVVTDNYSPGLSATQSFSVIVNPLTPPSVTTPVMTGGQIGFSVGGQVGPDYAVQASTNLVDWDTLLITNPAAMPFSWTTNTGALPVQLFRIQVGPPLP